MGRGLVVLAFVVALTACGGGAEPVGTATTGALPPGTTAATPTTTPPESDGRDLVADPPTLGGTAWAVTELTSVEWGFTNVWDHTTVTLEFGADGSLSGSTGCNDLSGTWSVEGGFYEPDPFSGDIGGQALSIDATAGTGGECDEDALEQEADLLGNLADTTWFDIVDDFGLVLYDADQHALIWTDPLG